MKKPERLVISTYLTTPHKAVAVIFLLVSSFTLSSALTSSSSPSTPTVQVHQGTLYGVTSTYQKSGRQYHAFRGIPYAKPPLGELRFAKPSPHGGFAGGAYNASEYGPACVQRLGGFLQNVSVSEDCLTLNVFVPVGGQGPTTPSSSSSSSSLAGQGYPVLVFIHGGGFVMWSAHYFEMAALVTEGDIIVVTLQYRLGILGFLSSENSALPGNFGLWDQLLALQWLKDNIAAFGGDPNRITISGESAGSASVSYLTLSPHVPRDLFHRALLQSGTATSSWALSRNPRNVTTVLAQRLGCHMPPSGSSLNEDEKRRRNEEFLDCLRAASVESLMAAGNYKRSAVSVMTDFVYVPCVDGDFVPQSPHAMLNDSAYLEQVGFYERDYLTGVTNNEGSLVYSMASSVFGNNITAGLTDPEFFDHDLVKAFVKQRFGQSNPSMEKIASFFYTAPRLSNSKRLELSDVLDSQGDVGFYVPLVDFTRAVAMGKHEDKRNLVYYFNHYPKFMTGELQGIPHGVDLSYEMDAVALIAPLYGNVSLLNDDDDWMGQAYRSVILDFVQSSVPGRTPLPQFNGSWVDFDEDESYLSLSPHNATVLHHLHGRRVALWRDLLPQFNVDSGQSSVPTSSVSTLSVSTSTLILLIVTQISRSFDKL